MEKTIKVTCPKCGTELTIEKKTAKTAQQRIEALRAAGVDVSHLFAMTGANGGECIASNADGNLRILQDDDPIFEYIVTAGTVNNKHLFRRWVMAQMFHMLTEKDYHGRVRGFTDALHRRGYDYTWTMVVKELYAQMKMWQNGDKENFAIRHLFFNANVVGAMARFDIAELRKAVATRKIKKCKGVPYVTLQRGNYFVADLEKKVFAPLEKLADDIARAKNITALYYATRAYDTAKFNVKWDTPQCPKWVDAYKGAGAYYTLQNMIRFHKCYLWDERNKRLTKEQSLYRLDQLAEEYKNEGWRLLGVLKKALKDNNVDIEQKIASWRKK